MQKSRIKRARSSKKKDLPVVAMLPSIRGGAQWHVRAVKQGETPHTLNLMGGSAEMALPTGHTREDELTKLHEMLHAAHSPLEEPRGIQLPDGTQVSKHALMMAEEFRINMICRTYAGPEQMPTTYNESPTAQFLVEQFMKVVHRAQFMEMIDWALICWPITPEKFPYVPSEWTKMADRIHKTVYDGRGAYEDLRPTINNFLRLGNDFFVMIFEAMVAVDGPYSDLMEHETIPSWETVIDIALLYDRILDAADALQATKPGQHGQPGEDSSGEGEGEQGEFDSDDPDVARARKHAGYLGIGQTTKTPEYKKQLRRVQDWKPATNEEYAERQIHKSGGVTWGKIKYSVARLTEKLPKKFNVRGKFRSTDEGAVPRYVHRLPIDGKIFARKKRINGGTVLIDDSGSMSWGTEDLMDIMKQAPAALVAAYSGMYQGGELKIVAQDGKCADMKNSTNRPEGGNNVVDFPAIQWLAAQPKPRIWVTDGGVIPTSGDWTEAFDQCMEFAMANNINVVLTAEEAAEVFEGKREIYR